MFSYIEGIVKDLDPTTGKILVVTNSGLGYTIQVDTKHPPKDDITGADYFDWRKPVALYVYAYVHGERSLTFQYYGFVSQDDLTLFKALVELDGVSTKKAFAVIKLGGDNARAVIAVKDIKALCKANGIGAKLATTIIDKLYDQYKVVPPVTQQEDKEPLLEAEIAQKKTDMIKMLADMYKHKQGSIGMWLVNQRIDWNLPEDQIAANCLKLYARELEKK